MNSANLNIQQIICIAKALGSLKERVVFVGGSTTSLLVSDIASFNVRQTEDVDFVIEIVSIGEFRKFEEQMGSLGFKHDQSKDAPICRWFIDFLGMDLKVDAVPADPKILGFANCWYKDVIRTATSYEIDKDIVIKVIHPVYFLATKFEAFKDRGDSQIFSHDLEDIIFILEHRDTIEMEFFDSEKPIKDYLGLAFQELLKHPDIENTLPGLVDGETAVDIVLGKMRFMSS